MPTLATRLFLGLGDAAEIYRWGSAPTDAGAAVVVRAESARYAPAGVGGEAIFTALIPVISYNAAATVRFVPIVDDVVYDGQAGNGPNAAVEVVLAAPATGHRVRYRKELGLSMPYVRDGVDRGRFALRGVWFQCRVEITSAIGLDTLGQPGEVVLEGYELEFEPVGVTQDAVPAPAYP